MRAANAPMQHETLPAGARQSLIREMSTEKDEE